MDLAGRKKLIAIIAVAVLLIAAAVALLISAHPTPDTETQEYYLFEDAIYRPEYPLSVEQLAAAAEKINSVIAAHGEARSFTLAIVPDKNYYLPEDSGIPKMDYARLVEHMESEVNGCNYVNLFDLLSLEGYYRTDPHWRQEKILVVADVLSKELGAAPAVEYDEKTLSPYEGVYLKRSKLSAASEEMVYLTSEATEDAVVTSVESDGTDTVYRVEDFHNADSYDVFLGGAAAVQYIENPLCDSNRELVMFRDSFGSALAPLLLGGYSKITLVDPRYIVSELVDDYVNYENADVLFVYSTLLLNRASIMK